MLSAWSTLLESLRKRHRAKTLNLVQVPTLADYVARLPLPDRIPLLLAAYDRYRQLGPPPEEFCSEHYFESSVYSLVISQLLASQLDATESDVCAILHASFHLCGHGDDVLAPIRLAEKTFAGKPYTVNLFDAARAYRKTLQGLTAVQSQLAKQELDWMLWHDARRPEKRCWTRKLQLSLAAMPSGEAFAWQWMLRHTTHAVNQARGKTWLAEAERRLALLGAKRYRDRLDHWFHFPEKEPVRLNPPGSNMLRLLVSYGVLVPAALPVLKRLNDVGWASPGIARKVMTDLTWVQKER